MACFGSKNTDIHLFWTFPSPPLFASNVPCPVGLPANRSLRSPCSRRWCSQLSVKAPGLWRSSRRTEWGLCGAFPLLPPCRYAHRTGSHFSAGYGGKEDQHQQNLRTWEWKDYFGLCRKKEKNSFCVLILIIIFIRHLLDHRQTSLKCCRQ